MPQTFPFDLSTYRHVALDPKRPTLTDDQRADLRHNIELCRDVIVFFTAYAGARGLSGHSGGPYDTVPEVVIVKALMKHAEDGGGTPIVPIVFDEAGHRVATQYLLSVLEGAMPAEKLLHYREYMEKLPGHPERGFTPGVKFSGGRLGHIWPFVNGVAMAHPDQAVFMLGSDGSQQEGDDAEAARLAVAQRLNVKLLIDDNDVTIAGHPSNYMEGFDVGKTLAGHGLPVETVQAEDLDALFAQVCAAATSDGPTAVICKRPMAPGVPGVEGTTHGHDVFSKDAAVAYLETRGDAAGCKAAIEMLGQAPKVDSKPRYAGSSEEVKANRALFGDVMVDIINGIPEPDRRTTVRVFDCDLEGSTGLATIHKAFPDLFVAGGIQERGNFSAAAGFGMEEGRQGVFSTFSAFLEMCISEITMARLNQSNVLCHFSHSGVDDMADNTCHFGINHFFADGGIPGAPADTDHSPDSHADTTRLYFPGDPAQFEACVKRVFDDVGLRFVFSNRSKLPWILAEDGSRFYAGRSFEPGTDDAIRDDFSDGVIVSFGATLHRALAAVEALRGDGKKVGLVNKACLNTTDDAMMSKLAAAPRVLVAEELNVKTGLGSRFGSMLLKAGFTGRYDHIGTHAEGSGGLWRQMGFQGLDPEGIEKSFRKLMG
ncbi:transketolase C-terminal domain-containing protein [Phycisphaera mikurensis]|uniref:Putative transketolase n=1 Tax=Phycisphaera mikurensis (strain NBRC 102666 / KCTC 22515 / FYK2301M01) TaxID=1142394 RepID=I0IAU5_PHYMF|nr:transketolase C-terminal domain-containing protein [Phycisphaera mikurensis]MBB6442642.1 transketolase [Phycisphaera mikurensis]BAM02383.1 putative transketolase [Phycisphaera mikurensis NBRC 102666]